jgi:alanyl-tRNA synthetase
MKQPLFYRDAYTAEFAAKVRSIEKEKEKFVLSLEDTAFYPEGGGQPGDRGKIGGVPVLDVRKKDGEIFHYLQDRPEDRESKAVEPGSTVRGELDWERRFDFMQQHTGQHILSAILFREFGLPTVSVHQGEENTSIEIEADSLGKEELLQLEDAAMGLIAENRRIETFFVDEEELGNYDLRREPKVSGTIRIVRIEGCDAVACGGVHTATTGEVRLIRCMGEEKIRGRLRLHWKIGERALNDYREKCRIISRLTDLFSASQPELLPRVEAASEELLALRRDYKLLEQRLAALEGEKLLASEARGLRLGDTVIRIVSASYTGKGKDFLKNLATRMVEEETAAFCGVNETDKGLQWIIGLGAEAEKAVNLDDRLKELIAPIGGKGGGRAPLRQGLAEKGADPRRLFDAFEGLFEEAGLR